MKIKRICRQCKKEFEIYLSKLKHNEGIFCSRKCKGKWQSEHKKGKNNPNWKGGKVKRICKQCSKEFEVVRIKVMNGEGIFCSRRCTTKWLSKNQRGMNNPNWQGGKIERMCLICGKNFEVDSNVIQKGRGKYCSYLCNRKVQKFPQHHTKPELIFDGICKKYNLPFKYTGDGSFWIGVNSSINPDFVECNGKKIAIEIFSYWHDPLKRHCKVPYSQTYEGRKAILKKYGWELIVFWQDDLKGENAEQFVLNILSQNGIEKSNDKR